MYRSQSSFTAMASTSAETGYPKSKEAASHTHLGRDLTCYSKTVPLKAEACAEPKRSAHLGADQIDHGLLRHPLFDQIQHRAHRTFADALLSHRRFAEKALLTHRLGASSCEALLRTLDRATRLLARGGIRVDRRIGGRAAGEGGGHQELL